MPHPIHVILHRFLHTEQFAFDASERELWPSERFPPFQRDPGAAGTAEPRETGVVYRELEPQN